MKLALAGGAALLVALLTWLLLRGIDTNASAYADAQRAFGDFTLAETSIGRDVLQARAGLLGNYDVLVQAEAAMESAVNRLRLYGEGENLDPKPVERLAAAVGQYEDLIERFKSSNSLLQNSLSYVGQLSTEPAFGALGDQLAPSTTAVAAAVLRLSRDSSAANAKSLQEQITRFEAQAPTGGPNGEVAHALLAHARLLSDLLPEVDQTLRHILAAPVRQPLEETRELMARARADFEVTAQRFRVVLYVVSLALLALALRLGLRLRTRTLRIRRLVEANIIGIFIWDFDGRILEANEAFLHIVGYEHEDLVAGRLRWTDLTPPEWRDRDAQLVQEHRVAGTLKPFEKEYFRKDGSRVPVLIGVATFEGSGKQGVAFVIDLTERKRAEEALRRGEAWLEQAQRLSHTGTWVMNATTRRFVYWSEESYRIWGLDPLQGLPSQEDMWARVHPDDRERVRGEVQEAIRGQSDFIAEFRILLPDGTVKYLEANSRHEFSSLGALLEVLCTTVDVTERKRAQEEHEKLRQLESDLAHMNRLSVMGELAASLAHEIAQPIGAARNNARAAINFLARRPSEPGEVREALSCVVNDADRAGEILDRIRDQIKKTSPRKGSVDLNQAITDVIALAQSEIIRNEVSIQTDLIEGLPHVQADRVQLQQVILNLILNAVEAMGSVEKRVRTLSVSTEQHQSGGVLASVRDSGPGIDPGHLDRVFDPFYTTKSSGVGMGLSICRSIIIAHGGKLWADANPSGGAIFRLTLPSDKKNS